MPIKTFKGSILVITELVIKVRKLNSRQVGLCVINSANKFGILWAISRNLGESE